MCAASGQRPGPGHYQRSQLSAVPSLVPNFHKCLRARFPKPNLVWPSGAAVQSALLKGDLRLRQRDVGESLGSWGLGGDSQSVQERQEAQSAKGAFSGLKACQYVFTIFSPVVPVASVHRRPRRLAGATAPAHVLFLKEVPRPSGTSRTKARPGAQPFRLVPAPP